MHQIELPLTGGVSPVRGIDTRRLAGIRRCASPLETSLALAFSGLPGFQWRLPFAEDVEIGRWPRSGVILEAQWPCGPYWADFCLRTWRVANDAPIVIVEVDGTDYHDRTTLQLRRDRKRDRYMTERGAAVLRFTGSEVWQDARGCVSEVWGFAGRRLKSVA